MKKISFFILLILPFPLYAQRLLGTLSEHQDSLQTESKSTSTESVAVTSSTVAKSLTSGKCEENDQTSLPLAYILSLIQDPNPKLDIIHDARSGTLSVSGGDMISNCSNMLDWNLRQEVSDGKKTYAVEVKFKKPEGCTDQGCVYKVAKIANKTFDKYEDMTFQPTLKGFEECLEKSGAVVNNEVIKNEEGKAVFTYPISPKFPGAKDSGELLFVSHGPATGMIKAKYDKFVEIRGCDSYEKISPDGASLLSYEDENRSRLDLEANKLKDCSIDEYYKVADFLEKYESYASELGDVRDRLILEAAKTSAKAITDKKYTDEDLKVMADFDKYIVEEKVNQANALYNETLTLEGDAKKAKQAELKAALKEIVALNSKPYFLQSHLDILVADGRFDEAEQLHTMKLNLVYHARLGAKEGGVVLTPDLATVRILQDKDSYAGEMAIEKENYSIRTGETTGLSDAFAAQASSMRKNIEIRTANYTSELQSEYARMQAPSGYCYAYFRNTQKCIQDSMERIQELQREMIAFNKVDAERAAEYDEKAAKYAEMEKEGRRYIAAQNGEAIPEEDEGSEEVVDNTAPSKREDLPVYTFDFNQSQQQVQQQPITPYTNQNMFQPQVNPYQYQPQSAYSQYPQYQNPYAQTQQYQQPWLAQSTWNQANSGYNPYMLSGASQGSMNGGYNFSWNGGGQSSSMYGQQGYYPQQSQQQSGYWQQPYSAYGNYNMYGYR